MRRWLVALALPVLAACASLRGPRDAGDVALLASVALDAAALAADAALTGDDAVEAAGALARAEAALERADATLADLRASVRALHEVEALLGDAAPAELRAALASADAMLGR